jgi:predicted metal-dependent hydrolase
MNPAALRTLRYGDETIAFSLHVQPGRQGRIAIRIEPDGRVRVDVPPGAQEAAVQAAVRRRARWISAQLAAIRERLAHAPPRAPAGGASLLYLGRRHALALVLDERRDGEVRLSGERIELALARLDAARVQAALEAWYRARAAEVMAARLAALLPALPWVRTPPPLRLRAMKRRWGSCSPAGRLTLNPDLVKASPECIDYVLIHELSHLKERGHGPRFRRLLDAQMPDWRTVKARLDGWGAAVEGVSGCESATRS